VFATQPSSPVTSSSLFLNPIGTTLQKTVTVREETTERTKTATVAMAAMAALPSQLCFLRPTRRTVRTKKRKKYSAYFCTKLYFVFSFCFIDS
jgi:hypothetical protein